MSWEFIVFIVFAVPALLVWAGVIFAKSNRKAGIQLAGLLTVIALAFLFFASYTVVGTRNIAIETWFNRPVGTMGNGWQWHAPWAEVDEWDGKLQNLRFSDVDEKDVDENGKGIAVRLAGQSTATVDLIFQYRITDSEGTVELFRDYGSEASVRQNAVQKALQAAVNRAFANYDPITALAQTTDRSPTVGMAAIGQEALTILKNTLPAGLAAVDLRIVMPHYDAQTEGRIQAYNAAVQDTAIAKQREKTALAIKAANTILAQSNASPGVLYQNCLDMVERVTKAGRGLPAGFSCSPGGSVVIPSAR